MMVAMLCVFSVAPARAQDESSTRIKSPSQRLSELEERVKDLENEVKTLEEEKAEAAAAAEASEPFYADGVFTVGGVELRIGGRADFLFVDTENYSDPIVGETDEKDPYFEVNRLRIVPRLRFNRHISARGQIDFSPDRGTTRLKEFTVRHRAQPVWWFRSNVRLGLDDRIIRQQRGTRTYPLIGNAFWRDESLGAVWSLRFGNRRGKPVENGEESTEDEDVLDGEALDYLKADNVGELFDAPVDPFDFSSNLGALTVHLSGGQGPVLDDKEIGRDNASFNDIVQDDRNIDDDQQISEVGVALEYQRDFGWLGELGVMGFFYHNMLGEESVDFLQQNLTIRDPGNNNPIAGYGDSNKEESWRYGIGAEYFFPASTLFGAEFTRRRDGLRLLGQWIHADDGDNFEREGWYAQASYRYSFPERLIAGRYLRSVEPLVRYGEMDTNLGPFVDIPTTWDRERLVVGLNIEVTNEILLRGEYAFNTEDTGGSPGSVDNDELVIELRLQF